jgi:predicted TIM-barrel fold metal-dependent hydrolase
VAEIERCAGDRRFVQVLLPGATDAPYGRRHYWPIFAAAARHGLTIGIHAGTSHRSAPTAIGWSSYFLADYVAFSTIAEGQLMSLLAEGVFQEFPTLKVVFLETGFMWYPAFIWRADKSWRGVRTEIPWVTQLPSEVAEAHVRFTLQPVDAPPAPEDMARMLEHLGSDRMLLFSSDYPHWHYDGLDALPAGFPNALAERLMVDNPAETYPRLSMEVAQ